MSVLNQSGEEQVECPLCMEPLEVDDLNFFPCTCGYQICRFCWHRIRTDENGLCPACRKAYSENPADFIPLSKEQVAQLKAEKRQRDQQRKAKLSESRKHLASVRVVQRNLVFVVGLPMRLADPEVLKKYEYFGKFGKIHKVVINQSTAYAGTQGPSASKPKTCLSQSAYVTYMKSDDALRAIQNVNNTIMDGKTIKTSLGTTKYCSHFMKNQPCPKPDCMYLHDFGDQEASFTKEQMHAGKHQEYEKKLHEALLSKLAVQSGNGSSQNSTSSSSSSSGGTTETQQKPNAKHKEGNQSSSSSNQQNKEGWPQLSIAERKEREKAEKEKQRGKRSGRNGSGEKKSEKKSSPPPPPQPPTVVVAESKTHEPPSQQKDKGKAESCAQISPVIEEKPPTLVAVATTTRSDDGVESNLSKLPLLDDNSSFFSQNSFAKLAPDNGGAEGGDGGVDSPSSLLLHGQQQQHNGGNEQPLLEIDDTDRWAFNFGYTKHSNHLEELAKQRTSDAFETNSFGVEPFGKLEATPFGQMDAYNTENLLETLAKNGVNYAQSMQAPSNGHLNGLDQHMSKFFTDFYRNGFNQQQQHLGGLNGYHQHHLNLADKHTIAFLQQRQLEEQLMNLGLTTKSLQQPATYGHVNGVGGQYDVGQCQNGGAFGSGLGASQLFGGGGAKSRVIPEEKELDFRFQEATKALEELVESDSHVHNAGRTNIGSSQINGLVHSQSSSHLPPPPPGFVQPNTHMNSFGSKILPYLNMNNSQQQQINSTQNSWPSNFSQTQQQQQQHKGMGMCNDWKILDPAILSSRRHIPNMPPLLDQYTGAAAAAQTQPPLPRSAYDGAAYNNGFSNFSPLQPQQNYGGYSHSQPSLNWLGGEINTQISSPPGFRTSGQATKQQEC